MKFPDGYLLWKNADSFSVVTGKKTFTGKISVNEIVVNNLVDGIAPRTILTLSFDQKVPGNFTFVDFELTESLNVSLFMVFFNILL